MPAPLRGRRPKRKPQPDKKCLTSGCGAIITRWKWLCDACFGELPYPNKKEICDARAANLPARVFGLSRTAAAWVATKREGAST